MGIELAKWIPWLPAVAAALCGLCLTRRSLRTYAAPICIASIVGAFLITLSVAGSLPKGPVGQVVKFFDWIRVDQFAAGFSYYIDPLTIVMLMVVTGVGSLVAVYASGYMAGDRGYARFFAAVSLFIFAMTNLVMADNLVLMYLGWEGVGLCSYLLIGFYYDKPSAVAAAKKAFIVNRIGDLGFALGIMLTYQQFGTVQFADYWVNDVLQPGIFSQAAAMSHNASATTAVQVIPFLLMLGAFGKSAQLPLYVWLPDAMEGPTPVSALIHAATMVTAGVYMIARLLPVFELSPYALPTVAVVGALTALFAATIALCQYDIKRVFAYSTISQLGYMFLGIGALSSVGAVFHLFTHAFFKALLFLTAGSVMHSLTGQLDMRKMSGLSRKMPVTCWLMFLGCLALAGFPFTAGFYSKDTILADTLAKGLNEHRTLFTLLAFSGLITAFLTSYYTFRLWFRVFMGPEHYEMGDDHHGDEDDHGHAPPHGGHAHEPHEMSWLMNGPLMVLAVGAVAGGFLAHHWLESMVLNSSAAPSAVAASVPESAASVVHDQPHGPGDTPHATLFGMDLHVAMMLISGVISIGGIALAWYFHLHNRPAADAAAAQRPGLVRLLANKYYVDEALDRCVVQPLRAIGHLCFVIDRLIIDGLVTAVSSVPRVMGMAVRPTQRGEIQGYGIGMAVGLIVLMVIVFRTIT